MLKFILEGIKKSPSNGTAIGVGAALASRIPQEVMKAAYENMTVKITLSSHTSYYYELCEYLNKNALNFVSNKISLDLYTNPSIGYGTTWARLMGSMVKVDRIKDDKAENLHITFFLTTKEEALKKLNDFFESCKPVRSPEDYHVYVDLYNIKTPDKIDFIKSFKARNRESIFVDPETLDYIDKRIETFLVKKSWYENLGIPYKYSLMLHGKPGTGKTTIAKYIAGKLKRNLVTVDPSLIASVSYHFGGRGVVVLMEDIDCDPVTLKRTEKVLDSSPNFHQMEGMYSLGEVLNGLDGVNSIENCVIIATTNHLKKLDPALLRKGRFDDVVEIKALETPEIIRMIKYFFGDNSLTGFKEEYKSTPGAVIQDLILNHYDEGPEKVIEVINKKYGVNKP